MPEVKGLKTYRLGELIELCDERNTAGKYTLENVRGMTITKEIIPTKADMNGTDVSKFWVVKPNDFIYNPRTHGKHIGLGFNNTKETFLISWNNVAFHVKQDKCDTILPEYLFMHFNRDEWDREACYQSWGTSTEVFTWEALCDMKLPLPPLEVQKKYVAVYQGAKANLEAYQSRLSSLKLVCDGMIDKIKSQRICSAHTGFTEKEANGVAESKSDGNKKDANGFVQPIRASQEKGANGVAESKSDGNKKDVNGFVQPIRASQEKGANDVSREQIRWQKLGDLIEEVDERNTDGEIVSVNGVNKDKTFMPAVAAGEDLTKYKVVRKNQFACNLMHIGRDVAIPIALQTEDNPIIVSPAYIVFRLKSYDSISDYIQLWLSREETGRYACFLCDSSVRSGMEKTRFFDITIPLPPLQVQKDIVNIYKTYIERGRIASALKEQIKKMCPVLIRGSISEVKG